ncbi:amidohydrolase [Fluviicola taffensis]|uniref:Amidohydrolase 3 n=1 Tax=Fluviicola taffensis (strain DSM 16823 / NCIMB 13979 / RW262) TaxID=755732 RepID=F2IHB4_FLUTR|nr:amidohydrolase [Fluviicola taffensis]AEA42669.1 Amidohydrolase 3 [Fluviicola taffensis DSM 16823]
MRYFLVCSILLIGVSCMKGKSVDLVIHNAKIHTMDDKNSIAQAIAIKDGKIVEVGPDRQIMNKYSADEFIDAEGKDVFPGFADAHGHLMSFARQKLSANLVGCSSMEELVVLVEKYSQRKERSVIVGGGWDQSLWNNKDLPNNKLLNEKFPQKPVVLYRIDGHAVLVNDAALKKYGIDETTQVDGGAILKNADGTLSGVLLDNAISLVSDKVPDFSDKELTGALLEIQQELFAYGITDVHEAGLSTHDFQLVRNLVKNNQLTIGVYGMLYPTAENAAFAKKHGFLKEKNLLVRSFKVIGDGALGSRGALLKQPYSDDPHNHGLLTTSLEDMNRYSSLAELTGYQLNIHAIGDSTNRLVLDLIVAYSKTKPDHRWRIEHAQVLDPKDFELLAGSGAFPSVQPTHAVSDQRWAEARLGRARLKGAYAYNSLLTRSGMLAIGTDFPVENINPFLTIHAAINRKNAENDPITGFLIEEALTEEACLRGMTIWAAFASFQEKTKGSLEKGKEANLVVLENPFLTKGIYHPNFAYLTFLKGKRVFSME